MPRRQVRSLVRTQPSTGRETGFSPGSAPVHAVGTGTRVPAPRLGSARAKNSATPEAPQAMRNAIRMPPPLQKS